MYWKYTKQSSKIWRTVVLYNHFSPLRKNRIMEFSTIRLTLPPSILKWNLSFKTCFTRCSYISITRWLWLRKLETVVTTWLAPHVPGLGGRSCEPPSDAGAGAGAECWVPECCHTLSLLPSLARSGSRSRLSSGLQWPRRANTPRIWTENESVKTSESQCGPQQPRRYDWDY